MDFLNQLDIDNKDDNSIFTFNDKNENNKTASLPFPFSSQTSANGNTAGDINFLNDIKSQGGESFTLGQIENENPNGNNNFGGFDFLNTICEVPESSNNIFNSQSENEFLSVNIGQNQGGLDFINEDIEKEENNFDISKFQKNNNNEEFINVDINNLFKSSKTKKNENFGKSSKSIKNQNFQNINDILSIGNNDKATNQNDNCDNNKNPTKNTIQININKKPNNISISNVRNNNNEVKEQITNTINTEMEKEKTSINKKNNNTISSIQNTNINNINKQFQNKLNNPNSTSNSISIKVSPSILPGSSSNKNINYNIKENKENIPSAANIVIKPTINKPQQSNNLDDIDTIISLNENIKSNNIPLSNISNNLLSINQNFLKQDNKIDIIGKDNLNYISNEISNIFNSSLINGKRSEIEPKDKDLQNIDNLLGFTKENITSKAKIKPSNSISKDKNNISMYNNIANPSQYFVNNTQKTNHSLMKPLPSDSFDKKSNLIKISRNEAMPLSQMETTSKMMTHAETRPPVIPKIEIIQKYNDLAYRLNKIREKAKEYRNLGSYFTQLIIANENYNIVYPNVLRQLLEDYNKQVNKLLSLMKIKNNKMNEMNNEFHEEVKKYSLAFQDQK